MECGNFTNETWCHIRGNFSPLLGVVLHYGLWEWTMYSTSYSLARLWNILNTQYSLESWTQGLRNEENIVLTWIEMNTQSTEWSGFYLSSKSSSWSTQRKAAKTFTNSFQHSIESSGWILCVFKMFVFVNPLYCI